MDAAALSALNAAFETADRWAGVATLVVVAGVFIELIVLFVFSKDIGKVEKGLLVFATTLIVLGVSGEWWYGGEAAADAEKLQADATTKAGNANDRAAILEKEAAELRIGAARLEKEAGRRIIKRDAFLRALQGAPKAEFELRYGEDDLDSKYLSLQLQVLLIHEGWSLVREQGVPLKDILSQSMMYPMAPVLVSAHSTSLPAGSFIITSGPASPSDKSTAFTAVMGAIRAGLGRGSVGADDPSLPEGRIIITVFPR